MNKRRQVQDKHEQFLIDTFISWWASQTGEQFTVISRPHPLPPEAIVKSARRTTWVEVTDAFYSDEWAQDLCSYATAEEVHRPMGPGPYVGMDAQYAERFASLLKKKLSKVSYAKPYQEHGPGILLVGMYSPWFDDGTCDMMRNACRKTDWSTDLGYFSRVYISFSSRNRQIFEEWIWNAQQNKSSGRSEPRR